MVFGTFAPIKVTRYFCELWKKCHLQIQWVAYAWPMHVLSLTQLFTIMQFLWHFYFRFRLCGRKYIRLWRRFSPRLSDVWDQVVY